jgi:hypothetical protein
VHEANDLDIGDTSANVEEQILSEGEILPGRDPVGPRPHRCGPPRVLVPWVSYLAGVADGVGAPVEEDPLLRARSTIDGVLTGPTFLYVYGVVALVPVDKVEVDRVFVVRDGVVALIAIDFVVEPATSDDVVTFHAGYVVWSLSSPAVSVSASWVPTQSGVRLPLDPVAPKQVLLTARATPPTTASTAAVITSSSIARLILVPFL